MELELQILDFIYKTNPFNYADLGSFFKTTRPDFKTVESALSVLISKKIIDPQEGHFYNDFPKDDLSKISKPYMVCLTERGLNYIEDRIIHKDASETNRNIRRNNRIIAVSAICTAILASVSLVISIMAFNSSEKVKPSLQLLNTSLIKQEQQLLQSVLCLKEINRSISRNDTILIRNVKP